MPQQPRSSPPQRSAPRAVLPAYRLAIPDDRTLLRVVANGRGPTRHALQRFRVSAVRAQVQAMSNVCNLCAVRREVAVQGLPSPDDLIGRVNNPEVCLAAQITVSTQCAQPRCRELNNQHSSCRGLFGRNWPYNIIAIVTMCKLNVRSCARFVH